MIAMGNLNAKVSSDHTLLGSVMGKYESVRISEASIVV